ncbi:hypothetical protein GCM10009133_21220 [Cocleimonas flava]|uniref:Uncharacterized protein n=1 Tax=Cocleimonas flava TaxID=634765 RepID=A0A4R1EN65_9GAMM|nr:hypothetical protein [Cocleimonas flava]TCJ82657.1 hypothetical protein EV695_3389 [Cocleimonas flava]
MTNIQAIKSGYNQTKTGSIDYNFYDQRARSIRSESIWSLFKGVFSDKENSPVEATQDCEVVNYNVAKTSNEDVNTMKHAA